MTDLLAALVAAWLTVQPTPPVEAAPSPADEALTNRFVAALPPARPREIQPDPFELERLAELNRGREAEIGQVLEAEAACEAPLLARQTMTMLRGIARSLGREKVEALIAFYEGSDFDRFGELSDRGEAALSDAERTEMAAIVSRYPLAEFNEAMWTTVPDMVADDPIMAELAACRTRRDEALGQAGLALHAAED